MIKIYTSRFLTMLIAAAVIGAISGCSMLNRDNTRLLNLYEKAVVPEKDSSLRAWTAPLTVPGGWLCLMLDAAVVNPVCTLDDAYVDSANMFEDVWDNQQWNDHYVRECVVCPLRVLGTGTVVPVTGMLSWTGRWIFDIDPAERHSEKTRSDAEQELLRKRVREVRKYYYANARKYERSLNYLDSFDDDDDVQAWLMIRGRNEAGYFIDLEASGDIMQMFTRFDRDAVKASYRQVSQSKPLAMLVICADNQPLVLYLDDEGFSESGQNYRFGWVSLADAIEDMVSARVDAKVVDIDRLKNALTAGRKAASLKDFLKGHFSQEYYEAIEEFTSSRQTPRNTELIKRMP